MCLDSSLYDVSVSPHAIMLMSCIVGKTMKLEVTLTERGVCVGMRQEAEARRRMQC